MSTLSTQEKYKPRLAQVDDWVIDGWITLHHTSVWNASGLRSKDPVHIKADSIREVRPYKRESWNRGMVPNRTPVQSAILTVGSDPAYFVYGSPTEILALIDQAQELYTKYRLGFDPNKSVPVGKTQ